MARRILNSTQKYWLYSITVIFLITNFLMIILLGVEWVEIKGDWHIKGSFLQAYNFNGRDYSKYWNDFYHDECDGLNNSHFRICDKIEKIWVAGIVLLVFHLMSWAMTAVWMLRFCSINLFTMTIGCCRQVWNWIGVFSLIVRLVVTIFWVLYLKAGFYGGCDWKLGDSEPDLCYKGGIGLAFSTIVLVMISLCLYLIYSTDTVQQRIQHSEYLMSKPELHADDFRTAKDPLTRSIGVELGTDKKDETKPDKGYQNAGVYVGTQFIPVYREPGTAADPGKNDF